MQQPSPSPTNAPTKTVTPSPKPSSTATPTPKYLTPTPVVTLAPVQGSAGDYRLVTPEPEEIIKLDLQISQFYNQDLIRISNESLLQYEWERSYSPEQFSDDLLGLVDSWWNNYKIQTDLLTDYVLFNLNEREIALIDNQRMRLPDAEIKGYLFDQNGDGGSVWMVWVIEKQWNFSFLLTLDRTSDERYTELYNNLPMMYGGVEEVKFSDLDGDGINDMILIETDSGFGDTMFRTIATRRSPKGIFHVLSSANFISEDVAFRDGATYEWFTSPNNGLLGLRVKSWHELPWDCVQSKVLEFQWLGGKERVKEYASTIESSPQCYIARTLDRVDPLDRRSAIRLLNLASNQPGITPAELVYIYYRLALLEALEGEDWAARQYINQLNKLAKMEEAAPATALYASIQPLLEEAVIQPYKLCLAAEAIAQEIPEEQWSAFKGYTAYPYTEFNEGYPAALCDSRHILEEILTQLLGGDSEVTQAELEAAGLEVLFFTPVGLSGEAPAYLAVIGEQSPWVSRTSQGEVRDQIFLVRYIQPLGWEIISSYIRTSEQDQVQVFTRITSDETTIIYPILLPENWPSYSASKTGCTLQITTNLTKDLLGTDTIQGDGFCLPAGQSIPFEELLKDTDGDQVMDVLTEHLEAKFYDVGLLQQRTVEAEWMVLDDYDSELYSLIRKDYLLEDLDERFFASPDPTSLRSEIEFYRSRWGEGKDSSSSKIYSYLTYLLALTYEMEVDEANAVELFYDIWTNHPETDWAYLAASRLALK